MKWIRLSLGLIVITAISVLATFAVAQGMAYDWRGHLKPAALDWRNPYAHPENYNPPWLYFLLHPVAKTAWPWDYAILTACCLLALFLYVKSPLKVLGVVVSAPGLIHLIEGQVDAFIMLSLILPAVVGLPVAAMKPQGLGLAALRRATPIAIVVLVAITLSSTAIWGVWFGSLQKPQGAPWLFWPMTVLPGLALAFIGWRRRSDATLCLSTLCLAPYYSPSSLVPFVAASLRETKGLIAQLSVIIFSWVWYLILYPR